MKREEIVEQITKILWSNLNDDVELTHELTNLFIELSNEIAMEQKRNILNDIEKGFMIPNDNEKIRARAIVQMANKPEIH